MSDTVFTNTVTLTDADWFNDLNRLHYTIFADAATVGAARTAIGLGTDDSPTFTGLTLSGTLTGSAISASVSSNAVAGLTVSNTNSGTGAVSATNYTNGTQTAYIGVLGGSFTTAGVLVAGRAVWRTAQNMAISSDGTIFLAAGGTTAVATVSSTGVAVTGVVSTTDPAGGAGPNWKLGVAASVSPTSPNRTIRIDIGGTSYYLHAKTTND